MCSTFPPQGGDLSPNTSAHIAASSLSSNIPSPVKMATGLTFVRVWTVRTAENDVWKSHVVFLLRHAPKVKKTKQSALHSGYCCHWLPARGGGGLSWKLVRGAGGCARRGHVTPRLAAIACYKSTSASSLGLFCTAGLPTSQDAFSHGRYVAFGPVFFFISFYPTRRFVHGPTNFWNALTKSPCYSWLSDFVLRVLIKWVILKCVFFAFIIGDKLCTDFSVWSC